jgi:UDP-N-acetylglucosamine 2-epimerase (non-hydrolysing)
VILVVFGTTGELIKLAPVLVRLQERGRGFLLVTTGQQVTQIPPFLEQFGLAQPDVWLGRGAHGHDLEKTGDIPRWLAGVTRSFARRRGRIRGALRGGEGLPLVLVHGDTMTTVLGALMGRALRAPVAHIEAGLRSGDLRNPFPEELDRRLTSLLAHVHYAPGAWAAANVRRGVVVDTGSNTIRDSLELVPPDAGSPVTVPNGTFGIVSLHRFELLNDAATLERTMRALADASEVTPLLFVDHPVTRAALQRRELGGIFDGSRVQRIPRARFFDFVRLERACTFVVTDSGGSQEECFYLDKPCLVHRRRTERREGLGENVVLSGLDEGVLRSFLADPSRHRRTSPLPDHSPSDRIVEDMVVRGFA